MPRKDKVAKKTKRKWVSSGKVKKRLRETQRDWQQKHPDLEWWDR